MGHSTMQRKRHVGRQWRGCFSEPRTEMLLSTLAAPVAGLPETAVGLLFPFSAPIVAGLELSGPPHNCLLIIVTGFLTPSEGICHRFTQSFFLAPQESGGYFVLNNVFRFISERQPAAINQVATQKNESSQIAISASETFSALPLPTTAEKSLNSDHVTVENNVTERQVINPSVSGAVIEYKVTTEPPVKVAKEDPKRAPVDAPPPAAPTHRDVTKKSYASIVSYFSFL
jgi:hypothetical protein